MDIVTVTDEGFGHSSHVVHLGDGTALVIDPARLPDRQRRLVGERGWRIEWTADSHSHADYISGSFDLAADGARSLPERNRLGPRVYPSPPALTRLPGERVAALIDDGAALIDVRPIARFAAAHPAGAISNALRGALASWLGWLVPLDTPLAFLLDDDQDRAELVRQCLTIGHEQLLGEIDGGIEAWAAAGLPVSTAALVDPEGIDGAVIDVRQAGEWRDGHLPGAVHVELGALADRPLPDGPVTVMCGHGERAMTAASLLSARGRSDVHVLAGGPVDWSHATGRALVTEP